VPNHIKFDCHQILIAPYRQIEVLAEELSGWRIVEGNRDQEGINHRVELGGQLGHPLEDHGILLRYQQVLMSAIVNAEKGQRGDKVNQHWAALAVRCPLVIH